MGKILGDTIRRFREIIAPYPYLDEPVSVIARPLTAEEAIGRPEHDDYPLLKGKERMMEARFKGAAGQAYTDRSINFPTADSPATRPLSAATGQMARFS